MTDHILTELRKGVDEIIPESDLVSRLEEGRPLRVKVGFDPTAPDLHLGHTVVVNKMRQFQELGHEIVFLIGDFTGMIGDPSGKSAERNLLDEQTLRHNQNSLKEQLSRFLDFDWRQAQHWAQARCFGLFLYDRCPLALAGEPR